MNTRHIFNLCLSLGLLFGACSTKATSEPPAKETPKDDTKPQTDDPKTPPSKDPKPVIQVSKLGNTFSPPITQAQLPKGAWFCGSKGVEWAAMQKPSDGTCPVQGATLQQNQGTAAATPPKPHGHDHGEHGHDHADKDAEKREHGHDHGDHGHHGHGDHDHTKKPIDPNKKKEDKKEDTPRSHGHDHGHDHAH